MIGSAGFIHAGEEPHPKESERLSKQSTVLYVKPGQETNYWHDDGLLRFPFSGQIVGVSRRDREWFVETGIKPKHNSVRLSGIPTRSLAPIEAILLLGGDAIKNWLNQLGWEPEWGYNDNFPHASTVDLFLEWWQERHPLFDSSATGVLGGWHYSWPSEDWHSRLGQNLLAWNVGDEPWVEVWATGTKLLAIERIT